MSSTDIRRRLLGYLTPYRAKFGLALMAMVLYGATDGIVPLLIRKILDDIFGARRQEMLYLLPTFLVVFALVRGLFNFMQHYLTASVGLAIVRDLRNDIHRRLLSLSLGFFERQQSGSIISSVTNDTLLVRQALTDSVASALRDGVRVVALLIAAFYLDPVLALIAFVGFPLGLIPVMRFGRRVRRLSRSGQDQFGGLTSILHESIGGHAVVQSFGLEAHEQKKFERENEGFTQTLTKAEKYGSLSGPTNEVLASIAMGGVILYGGLTVISGVRTQGDFIAFITAMFLLYEPLKKLGRLNMIYQVGMGAAERVFAILDAVPEVKESPAPAELTGPAQHIRLKNVWFTYGDEKQWALRDISLDVANGETVALVGMSGGGKTTLVKLLPRFYDPQRGTIEINERNIREYSLRSLRQSISMVSQHTFLFDDTAFNNILLGRPEATEREVYSAAEAANAHGFVTNLPQGYQTRLGEQGFRLSGGERARMAIARALLKNAPILVLDEATAALDSESERTVHEALDRLMARGTTIVIAHRLATIQGADRIVVLKHGAIVEVGRHEELLRRGGEYAKLYRIQFESALKEMTG